MLATFLYEGRCYTSCPERSYAVINGAGNRFVASSVEELIDTDTAAAKRVRPLVRRAIKMPDEPPPDETTRLCLACHFSCLKCRGPNDYDCTACAPDSVYTERLTNATYCLPLGSISKLKRMYDDDRVYVVLLILVPALFILCFVLFISWLLRTKYCTTKNAADYVQYNKIQNMDDEAGVGGDDGVGVRMPLDANDYSSSDDDELPGAVPSDDDNNKDKISNIDK